jgi:hypothetical protein
VCSEGLFVGQKGAGARVSSGGRGGVSGDVHGQSRVWRPWRRAGGVLSRRRGTVGMLWRAHAGRHRAESRGKERGVRVCSSSSPPCLTAWVGAGEAGDRPRDVHEHGYRARANVNSIGHSDFDFLDFCPPGARHNARKNSKFEFLKSFTLGCQHITQGFQIYFC